MGSQGFDLDIPGDPDASILDWFACRGFDIWRLDFVGYGRSDKPADHLATVAQGVPDLLAATDYIEKKRNSRSAEPDRLFLRRAARRTLCAEASRSGQSARPRRHGLHRQGLADADQARAEDGRVEIERHPQDRSGLPALDHDARPFRDRDGEPQAPYVDAILAIESTVPNGTYIDMCENLPVCDPKEIKVPTVILRGQHDGIATDEDLLEFFRLLPNPDKEYVMMPGIAHAAATSKNYLRFYDAAYTFFSRPGDRFSRVSADAFLPGRKACGGEAGHAGHAAHAICLTRVCSFPEL